MVKSVIHVEWKTIRCWKEMSVHAYESRIHEPRSISKFHLPADYDPDPVHL